MKRRGFLKFLGAGPAAAPAVAKALEPKDVEFEAIGHNESGHYVDMHCWVTAATYYPTETIRTWDPAVRKRKFII